MGTRLCPKTRPLADLRTQMGRRKRNFWFLVGTRVDSVSGYERRMIKIRKHLGGAVDKTMRATGKKRLSSQRSPRGFKRALSIVRAFTI